MESASLEPLVSSPLARDHPSIIFTFPIRGQRQIALVSVPEAQRRALSMTGLCKPNQQFLPHFVVNKGGVKL